MGAGARLHSKWPLLVARPAGHVPVSIESPSPSQGYSDRTIGLLSTLDRDSRVILGHTLTQPEAVPPASLDTVLRNFCLLEA